MINELLKSVIDQDRAAIVICDLNHVIVYMNKSAISNYQKHGNLIGKSVLDCHNKESVNKIIEVLDWFKASPNNNMIFTFHSDKKNKDVYMVALRNEEGELIGYYEKHEHRDLEKAMPYDYSNSLV